MPQGTSLRTGRTIAFLPLALLTACAAAPDIGVRPAMRDTASIAAAETFQGAGSTSWPADTWWHSIGDPQLAALIDEALDGSADVRAAVARYDRANAVVLETGAAGLPSLDVQGDASLDKQSYNIGFPREFVPKGWKDSSQIAASVGFDLDLWGRNRAALAAATSEARAAAVDARQARILLSTGIALAWYDLARLHEERDVRQSAVTLREATRSLVDNRLASGLETRGSLRQAEAQVATARANLAGADQAIAIRRHQIAALMGAGPDRGLSLARPKPGAFGQADLPDDITTALVARRPDIISARDRVEAAASRIKAARADFYPSLRIGALVGLQSLGIGNLLETGSTFGSAGPAISLPIFHGGALRGRYRSSAAAFDEAVAVYDKTVIAAYQQVADAVTSRAQMRLRLDSSRAALAASEEAYAVARLRYDGGLSNYLEVLVVEDRLLDVRLAAANLEAEAKALDVVLIRALGGGFDGTQIREASHD